MRTQLKRQIISILFFAGIALFAHAQVMITPQIPPTGLIKKDQLWNMVIVNNSETAYDIQLQVSMMDMKTGEKVLTGASRLISINKGARQLQMNDVSPVQYNYGSAAVLTDRASNGMLPVGSYQVCYTIIEQTTKNSLPATDECIPVEVAPLSPPLLNAPADNDTIATRSPLFQWIPPAPLSMFSNLNYEFVLVEVAKGQNVNDAIQKNTPIYYQSAIRNMFLAYPSSGKALEQGKIYAWQVIAKNGNSYAEKTESWAFTVKKDSIKIILDYEAYPAMSQGSNGTYYSCQGKIKFSYKNEINDSTLQVQFYKKGHEDAAPVFSKAIKVQRGQNYIDADIKEHRVFLEGEIYTMEAVNSKKEKWTLVFKYEPVKE